MSPRTANCLFLPMAAFALFVAYVVYPAARAVRAVYWGAVDLLCAAAHALLGDDDLADPTMRDPPPMPDEALLGGALARVVLIMLALVGFAVLLAVCLRQGLPGP
jgi:hypothetical protein